MGADISLARSRIRKKVGVAGAEWAKSGRDTFHHLAPQILASHKCHQDLPSASTANLDPFTWKCVLFLFYFFLAGKKYE